MPARRPVPARATPPADVSSLRATSRASRAERARRLSEQFRAQLERPVPARPAGLIGVEHEFTLRAGDSVLDFRELIHSLPVPGVRVDATDPNAYRCEWGGTITADGREAEIATPPVPVVPGFSSTVDAWSRIGGASLEAVLPMGVETAGYSTHVNVQVPEHLNDEVCFGVISRFVPALMLLTERAGSPGVLVRPRPGRVEVGTEFTEGPALRAAVVLLAGGVRALACRAAGRRNVLLPPEARGQALPASERFGWFVPHNAFGSPLAVGDRDRRLSTSRGIVRAGDQLEAAFEVALAALGDDVAQEDLEAVESVLASAGPFPSDAVIRGGDGPPPTPFSVLPRPPVRPTFDVRTAAVTWDLSIFHVLAGRRSAFASVPRDSLGGFLELLDRGELDGVMHDYLAVRSSDRVLSDPESAARPGLFDRVGALGDVLPREREPAIPGGIQGERPGKRDRDEQDDGKRRPRRRRPRWQLAAAAAVAAVVLIAGVAFALGRGGTPQAAATPVPLTSTPSAPATSPSLSGPAALAAARLAGEWSIVGWGSRNWIFASQCATGPCAGRVRYEAFVRPTQSIPIGREFAYTGVGYVWESVQPGWCYKGNGAFQAGYPVFRAGMKYTLQFTITVTGVAQIDGELRATAFDWTMQGHGVPSSARAAAWGCPASRQATASGTGALVV
jgi:hypothetical protein